MSDKMSSDDLNSPSSANQGSASATIAAPEFNESGTKLKLEAKSVRNAAQAYNICTGLQNSNKQRALRACDMQELADGRPPKSAGQNLEKAKSWEANFSSLWLAGIVGRVTQRFINAIISQTFVTSSALPVNYPDHKTKTDSLRAGFTALVRGWDGNTGFINAIATEVVLQGYGFALFLDPHTWHPTFFKQECCLVPEQATQHARDLQFFAARRDFRVDQFIDLFRDERAAETNGYNLKACLDAASKAVMQDRRDDAATTIFRNFADMIDEGAIACGMGASGERIVKTWLLFNREYDGKVSFWMLERDTGKELRFSFKLFDRMQDVMAMFSFEAGNGCIHSSKGLGRKLAALATVKELFRCGIVDNARMGGMMIVNVNSADKSKFAPVMMSPFILVDSSVDLKGAQQFQVSAEGYQIIDQLIDSWAEQAVGAYLAAQINDKGKAERTATEANIDARRENEAADIMIRRCLDQDANRIQMQQLRVCSDRNLKRARRIYERMTKEADVNPDALYPDDIDEANLLRFLVSQIEAFEMTDDEIKTWSKSPASAFAHVTEGAVQRGVSAAKAKYSGNPNIDQAALDYSDLEGMVGADMAKKLFIPKANETLAIEAGRAQMIESFTMAGTGQPVKVSPRDNHLIHGGVAVEMLTNTVAPQLSKADAPEAIMKVAALVMNHLGEHLSLAQAQGMNKSPAFKEISKFYEGFKKQLGQVVQIREAARVAQETVAAQVRGEDAQLASFGAPPPDVPGDFATDPEPAMAAVE